MDLRRGTGAAVHGRPERRGWPGSGSGRDDVLQSGVAGVRA